MTGIVETCETAGWQWLVSNIQRFLPTDPANPETSKQIGELALLYAQVTGWRNGAQGTDEASAVKDFLLNFYGLPEIVQLARKRPGYYNAYIVPYLFLRAVGVRIEGFEEALSSLHEAGYPEATEAVPYRRLELKYAKWKASLSSTPPNCDDLYSMTTLAMCRNPVGLVNWEVYSITHTIFYLTDLCGPPTLIPPHERQRIIDMIEALMVHYWRKSNFDLVGELLINLLSLNGFDRPIFSRCLDALLATWRNDGVLPGPTFDPKMRPRDEGSDEYLFRHCYHTTLVGLLLCGSYRHRLAEIRGGQR